MNCQWPLFVEYSMFDKHETLMKDLDFGPKVETQETENK